MKKPQTLLSWLLLWHVYVYAAASAPRALLLRRWLGSSSPCRRHAPYPSSPRLPLCASDRNDKRLEKVIDDCDVNENSSTGYRRRAIWRWVHGPAWKRALMEQEVEDEGARRIALGHVVRELIALPVSEAFEPMNSSPMHGKLQFSDKCSLPGSVGKQLLDRPFEVPWIFKVTRSRGPNGGENESSVISTVPSTDEEGFSSGGDKCGGAPLQAVYVSPLDFRAPENFIFMPRWAMASLGLRAFDRVQVSLVRLQVASFVQLRPRDAPAWQTLMQQISQTEKNTSLTQLLEKEINKYSALTAGTNISIQLQVPHPGNSASSESTAAAIHTFEVVKLQGEVSGERVGLRAVRVQDADVQVDIALPLRGKE